MAVMQIEYYSAALEDGVGVSVLLSRCIARGRSSGYGYSSPLSLTRDEWQPPLLVETDQCGAHLRNTNLIVVLPNTIMALHRYPVWLQLLHCYLEELPETLSRFFPLI